MAKSTIHKRRPGSHEVAALIKQMPVEQQAIATELHKVIRQVAGDLDETIKWGWPCYVGSSNVCSIIAYRDHVNLALFRGAELADPDGLLEGTGKAMRHVKVTNVKTLRKRAISNLIRTAAALDVQS